VSAAKKDWTAAEVKEKLRARHPATQTMGSRTIPGAWTCMEEWFGIDLLALCATTAGRVPYAKVGYEVKVSRADYRSELRKPEKRAEAQAMCHEFYFAVPRGILRDDELPGGDSTPQLGSGDLYVPEDVGLVVVDGRGTKVVKKAPLNREPDDIVKQVHNGAGWGYDLNALVRWVSARPDPRHDGVVEEARRRGREIAAAERERKEKTKQIERERERREREQFEGRGEDWHVGREWVSHKTEDDCVCPQEPCGLVAMSKIDPACPQHSLNAGKTLRQSHPASQCLHAAVAA
jgi:hypothetical protein